jgi:hypothetical protein
MLKAKLRFFDNRCLTIVVFPDPDGAENIMSFPFCIVIVKFGLSAIIGGGLGLFMTASPPILRCFTGCSAFAL